MASAPRDGTIVELECRHGDEPWYGLHRWTCERQSIDMRSGERELCAPAPAAWVNAQDAAKAVGGEHDLRWRPYHGSVAEYRRYRGFQRPGMLCPGEQTIQTIKIPMPAPIVKIVGPPTPLVTVAWGFAVFCGMQLGLATAREQWVLMSVLLAIILVTPYAAFWLLPKHLPKLRSRLSPLLQAAGRWRWRRSDGN